MNNNDKNLLCFNSFYPYQVCRIQRKRKKRYLFLMELSWWEKIKFLRKCLPIFWSVLAFNELIVNKCTQNYSPAGKTSEIKSCWLPKQFLEQLMRCYVLMEKTPINASFSFRTEKSISIETAQPNKKLLRNRKWCFALVCLNARKSTPICFICLSEWINSRPGCPNSFLTEKS